LFFADVESSLIWVTISVSGRFGGSSKMLRPTIPR
jgi:hypothetical protein